MLTVAIPTAEVSRTGGKYRSLSSATTKVVSLQKSATLAGKSWLKIQSGRSTQRQKEGDYILIGASSATSPPDEADEIRQVIRYADTFERLADDYAIITQV